jgi:YHS domain-containing protein
MGRTTMAAVTDPVCGLEFDQSQAVAQTVHDGVAYYFCSEACRETFEDDPEEFVIGQD